MRILIDINYILLLRVVIYLKENNNYAVILM